jgi:hypothetical protein
MAPSIKPLLQNKPHDVGRVNDALLVDGNGLPVQVLIAGQKT